MGMVETLSVVVLVVLYACMILSYIIRGIIGEVVTVTLSQRLRDETCL